eukprot:9017668-Karenia_brevis.AAC.1
MKHETSDMLETDPKLYSRSSPQAAGGHCAGSIQTRRKIHSQYCRRPDKSKQPKATSVQAPLR